jgi:hypothetical protein
MMSDLASYPPDHARAAGAGARLLVVTVSACHFRGGSHPRLALSDEDAGIFVLSAVTPHGGFLFPHQGDV